MLTLFSVVPFIQAITNINILYENKYINYIIGRLGLKNDQDIILITVCAFITFIVLANTLRIINLWITNKVAASLGSELSCKCFLNNLNQSYEEHINQNSSEIIAALSQYITKTIDFIYSFLQIIYSIIISLLIVSGLLIYSWKITIICSTILSLLYLLVIVIFKNRINLNSKLIVKNTNNQVKVIQESLGGIRDIILQNSQKNSQKYLNIATK